MAATPEWIKEPGIGAVKDLLERYRPKGLSGEDCSKEISDQDLEYISLNLCKNWRFLPTPLGMPELTENDIDQDHSKEKEKRRAFFIEWKAVAGKEGATYRRLIGALLEISSREDAESVCELLLSHLHPKLEAYGGNASSLDINTPDAYPPKIMKCIQQQLNRNREQIMYQYSVYVSTLCESIREKGVTVESLTLFLLNLPALQYHHDHRQRCLLAGKRKMFESARTIYDIFKIISEECASFINYGIFQSIATNYGVNLTDHKDLNYSEHLRDYLNKHKLSELVKVIQPMAPLVKIDATKMEMTFKLDVKLMDTFVKVYDLEIAIADALGLDPLALELADITEGCVMVTLLVPVIVTDVIFTQDNSLTDSQLESLKSLPIIWIKYKGHEYTLKNSTGVEIQMRSDSGRKIGITQETGEDFQAGLGYPSPSPNSQRFCYVPVTEAEAESDQEILQAEPERAPTGVVKLVQLSTNRRRQARLTGVNLSELDENTVNTIFSYFARSAEADETLSQHDCNAFRYNPVESSRPSQAIVDKLLMYNELIENKLENEGIKRLDDYVIRSILQRSPTQEGGNQETDSATEKFRLNFTAVRRYLLGVCSGVFTRETVANCTATKLLIYLAVVIKYCYRFCKRLILYAERSIGALGPIQVFSILCEVISAILAHLVNIQWRNVVSRIGGWVILASSTGLIMQPAVYIPIALICSAVVVGSIVSSYLATK